MLTDMFLWVTWWISYKGQELLFLPGHLGSPQDFAHRISFHCCVLCIICLRPVSCVPMYCPFFIAPSIFFNVYIMVNLRRESQERILTFKLSRDHIKHGAFTLCCGIVFDFQRKRGKQLVYIYKYKYQILGKWIMWQTIYELRKWESSSRKYLLEYLSLITDANKVNFIWTLYCYSHIWLVFLRLSRRFVVARSLRRCICPFTL